MLVLLLRVWALDVWGELVPSFPVLKAGHSVFYSCVCDVDREWVGFLSILSEFSYLASVLCTWFSCMHII